MERVPVDAVDSWAYRPLEAASMISLFSLFVVAGYVALLAAAFETPAFRAIPDLTAPFVVGGAILGIAWTVGTPVLLYADAKRVAGAETSWDLEPLLYPLLFLLFGWFVLVYYLYRRHEYVVDRSHGDFGVAVVACLAALVAVVAVPAGLAAAGVFYGGQVLFVGLPGTMAVSAVLVVVLYLDCVHVRRHCEWHPNPATRVFLGTFLALLPPLAALYGLYHVGRRIRSLGLR